MIHAKNFISDVLSLLREHKKAKTESKKDIKKSLLLGLQREYLYLK